VRLRQRGVDSSLLRPGAAVVVNIPPEAFWLLPEDDPPWLSPADKDAAHVLS
jgi:hypothetical protein